MGRGSVLSQRQLKVGELLRQALADIFMKEPFHDSQLAEIPVTIKEVRPTPDLKIAYVYVSPLGVVENPEEWLEAVKLEAVSLRKLLAREVRQLRYLPELHFQLDTAGEHASRIDMLLKNLHPATKEE